MKYLVVKALRNDKWVTTTVLAFRIAPLFEPDAHRRAHSRTNLSGAIGREVRAWDAGCRAVVIGPDTTSEAGDKHTANVSRWYVKNDYEEINNYLDAVNLVKD